jgi:23S rRNA (cytidine1920-2'-O)/16S rRNA (cytidine1409-2'-O)-methyltransferase
MLTESLRNSNNRKPAKQRLDLLLQERGLVENREQARRLILAGEVQVNDQVVDKVGRLVASDARIQVRQPLPYVSRGGLKLAAALDAFAVDVQGLTAIDVGASTGGFSDCLLQRGIARIYAVDVGYGQLAWKVRSDPRVAVLDRTNIRYLEHLPEHGLVDLAVIDASFIGLALVLPATLRLLKPAARVIALVKPQFEAGRQRVGKGGVVRDPATHCQVLQEIFITALRLGLQILGLTASPAPGAAGNIEFLLYLAKPASEQPQQPLPPAFDLTLAQQQMIDQALQAAAALKER